MRPESAAYRGPSGTARFLGQQARQTYREFSSGGELSAAMTENTTTFWRPHDGHSGQNLKMGEGPVGLTSGLETRAFGLAASIVLGLASGLEPWNFGLAAGIVHLA